jgi:hypothetical protein
MKKGRLRGENRNKIAICKEDQDGDPWSLLVDLYTCKTRFKAESELSNES